MHVDLVVHLLLNEVEILLLELELLLQLSKIKLLLGLDLSDLLLVLFGDQLLFFGLTLNFEVGLLLGALQVLIHLLNSKSVGSLLLLETLRLCHFVGLQGGPVVSLVAGNFLLLENVATSGLVLLGLFSVGLSALVLFQVEFLALFSNTLVLLHLVGGGLEVLGLAELTLQVTEQASRKNLDVSDLNSLEPDTPSFAER